MIIYLLFGSNIILILLAYRLSDILSGGFYGVTMFMRKIIYCLCVVFYGCMSSVIAKTAVESKVQSNDVSDFVNNFAKKILDIINKSNITHAEIINALRPVVIESMDIDSIAKFSMGKYYRHLTKVEKEKFTNSFLNMMLQFYGGALVKYKNSEFAIAKAQKVSDKHSIVKAVLRLNQKEYKLNCSLFIINGKWKILDISMDGIAMGPVQKAAIEGKIKASQEQQRKQNIGGRSSLRIVLEKFLMEFNKEYSDENMLKNADTASVT